jgi:pyruvate/2-oxoglutarate dehydrogenase complex dihydrolipoamide acyltransferase (E2) component
VSSSRTETTVQVVMPQMGVSVSEGTIVEWRKRPGDWIEADEMVCDITTDKIDVEVPSPASGRLARIIAEPGTTVPVGEAIAEIDTGAKPGEAHPEESADGKGRTGEPAPERDEGGSPEVDRSGFHSPVVRRIAEEHGVDLDRVEGTGVGGRVKKSDVLAFIESGAGEAAPAEERPEPVLHSESPYRPEEPPAPPAEPAAPPARPPARDGEPAVTAGERREPMSEMRKAIARHMVESRRTAAHATTIVEADFARVAARRAELRETMRRRGVNLTYLAFVARATVETLEEFPRFNASLDGDELVLYDDVNLGIAVALDDGLIVPVIRQAQRLSLEGMAAAIGDVAERARERRLEPDDVHGGTFTITNPGQFGAVLATPIINQPQVAILDLEAIVKRPVVVTGADGEDAIAVRPMSYLCLSWDHRALDGADAARFLARIKERIEQ